MKKILLTTTFLAIVILSFASYYYWSSVKPQTKAIREQVEWRYNSVIEKTESKDTVPSNWEIYTNSRLGFTFQYYSSWVKDSKDVEVVNLSGVITGIEINFTDTVLKTTLLISYRFAPKGTELYKDIVSQYRSSRVGKQIEVAGNIAFEVNTIISIDGRGNTLNSPLRLIVVDFLDKKQTGEIEVQFKTPLTCENNEVQKFNQLLSSFKFNN